MLRILITLALACALLWPAAAEARCRCTRLVPVIIDGAGTIWACVRRR